MRLPAVQGGPALQRIGKFELRHLHTIEAKLTWYQASLRRTDGLLVQTLAPTRLIHPHLAPPCLAPVHAFRD